VSVDTNIAEYSEKLEGKGLPLIFGVVHLAALLGLKGSVLANMLNKTSKFYREFSIPKRKGGERNIQSPQPSLLEAQRWIYKNLLSALAVHEAAHGFVKGRSPISNALPHCGADAVLSMDIRNFFPTIVFARVRGFYSAIGYKDKVAFALAKLCTLDGKLPQGAATSPILSNLLCMSLDRRLQGYARKLDCVYTRYADDLAFSGRKVPMSAIILISQVVKEEGFKINEDKTKLIRGKKKKIITGVSVATDQPMLPRTTKRQWRAEAHSFLKLGLEEHCEKYGFSPLIYADSLRGRMAHWSHIEPNNRYPAETLKALSTQNT